jgi:hypothetical protein
MTKEFRFLKDLQERLNNIKSENNVKIYNDHLKLCIRLCKEKYNNIGYDEESDSYSWDKKNHGPVMINFGNFDKGLSFISGWILFMSESLEYWALKNEESKLVVNYSPDETKLLKNKNIKELQEIHKIKINFEGCVEDGQEKRNVVSKKNKGLVKQH